MIKSQKGFTIVELLVATGVFSVILLGASFALVQVSRMYYKGMITSRTQEAARNVLDSVSRPVQLLGTEPNTGSFSIADPASGTTFPGGVICLGDQRFTYVIGLQVRPDGAVGDGHVRHALWRDTLPSPSADCVSRQLNDVNPGGTNGQDLLGERMRLKSFSVTKDTTTGMWNISVGVIYGDNDDLEVDASGVALGQCKANPASSQWCAVAEYKTQVKPRLVR